MILKETTNNIEEADVDNHSEDIVQLEQEFSPDQLARLDQLEQDRV